MSLGDKIKAGVLIGGISTLTLLAAAAGGAVGGAIAGEILDWVPYLNHAIPEGVAYVGNAFTNENTAQYAAQTLEGELDKVGAAAGFVGGYFKATLSTSDN